MLYTNCQNFVCCKNVLRDNVKHNCLHLAQKYMYDRELIICSAKLTVFLEHHSWKSVCFSEQIVSTDKTFKHIFASNGGYFLYL